MQQAAAKKQVLILGKLVIMCTGGDKPHAYYT